MDIESIAVDTLSLCLAETDYLVPYIKKRDKEPLWDGYVAVYRQQKHCHRNDLFAGRVHVQMKGKAVLGLGDTISYSISVNSLQHYITEGGAIFFVVGITPEKKKRIYFKALLPFDIRQELDKFNEQDTLTLHMQSFPESDNEIVELFLNHLQDKQKQLAFVQLSSQASIRNEDGKDVRYDVGFISIDKSTSSPFAPLFKSERYIYQLEKTNFGELTIPVGKGWVEKISTNVNGSISANGKQYFSSYKYSETESSITYSFGSGLAMIEERIAHESFRKGCLQYQSKGFLEEQIKDMEFFLDAIRADCVYIDSIPYMTTGGSAQEENARQKKSVEERLRAFKELRKILHAVGIRKNLDVENLLKTDEDKRNIAILRQAFLKKKPITDIVINDVPGVVEMPLYGYSICLYISEEKNGYRIQNFFKTQLTFSYSWVDVERKDATQFAFLNKKALIELSNIDFCAIVNDVKRFPADNQAVVRANTLLILNMLSAYDETKDLQLLNAAIEISGWLYKNLRCGDSAPVMLNFFQSVIRLRPLTNEEQSCILLATKKEETPEILLAGRSILLGDYDCAEKLIEKLPKAERDYFKSLPIYTLMSK